MKKKKWLVVLCAMFGLGASAQVFDPNKVGDLREGYTDRFTVPKDEPMVLAEGALLKDVIGVKGDYWLYHTNQQLPWLFTCEGPLETSANKEGVYHYTYAESGEWATCQFQGKWSNSYLMITTLKLTQDGENICGQVIGTSYPYNQPYGHDGYATTFGTSYYLGLDWTVAKEMVRVSLHNVELSIMPSDYRSRVAFVGKDGETLKIEEVPYRLAATAPTPPEIEGYVFWKWDVDFSEVKESITVTALYHRLCKVTFKDADGTILGEQIVEETMGATAPDMSDRENFVGWDGDIDEILDDLIVTAVYGIVPEAVQKALASGLLDGDKNALIWAAAEGTWDATAGNWYSVYGVPSAWNSGATAVFPLSAEVTIEDTLEVGKIRILCDAQTVTFKGSGTITGVNALTFDTAASVTLENTVSLADDAKIVVRYEGAAVASMENKLVIKGNLKLGSPLQVAGPVALKTVETGLLSNGEVTGDIMLTNGAVLELGSTAAQVMKGKIVVSTPGYGYVKTMPGSDVSFTSDKGASWELRVAGDSYVAKYNTLPQSRDGKGQTWVLDGGVLRMGEANGYWGPQVWSDEGIFVEKGGVVRLVSDESLGAIMGVTVNGGVVTNEAPSMNCLLYKWQMNDGSILTGKGMRVGYIDNYTRWSYIKVGGSTPCTVSLDEIQLGYQRPAQSKKYVGINFIVNNVTEDEKTDLLVMSPITERSDVSLLDDSAYRANLGVWKQGEGTLELAANNSCCPTGVFKCEAGTVRFPQNSGGSFGALMILGDATMDVKRGAKVTFADSRDMAWTEGATLSFTGDLGRRDVRVGTNAEALTKEQLAAIQYVTAEGKVRPMAIDADGYLQPPDPGLFITIR